MITTFYPPYAFGGDGVYVQQLSNELAKRGHQVEVVHCRDTYNVLARRTSSITEQITRSKREILTQKVS
jgi:hypothetical protein